MLVQQTKMKGLIDRASPTSATEQGVEHYVPNIPSDEDCGLRSIGFGLDGNIESRPWLNGTSCTICTGAVRISVTILSRLDGLR